MWRSGNTALAILNLGIRWRLLMANIYDGELYSDDTALSTQRIRFWVEPWSELRTVQWRAPSANRSTVPRL